MLNAKKSPLNLFIHKISVPQHDAAPKNSKVDLEGILYLVNRLNAPFAVGPDNYRDSTRGESAQVWLNTPPSGSPARGESVRGSCFVKIILFVSGAATQLKPQGGDRMVEIN